MMNGTQENGNACSNDAFPNVRKCFQRRGR